MIAMLPIQVIVTDEADNCDTSLDATYTDSDIAMGTVTVVGYITRTWTLDRRLREYHCTISDYLGSACSSYFCLRTRHSVL